jgi:hypothetical protein
MSIPVQSRLVKTPIDLTEEVVYQVPSDTTALLTQIMMCNTSGGVVTVNIAVTASASSSSETTDRIFSNFSLAANETVMIMTSLPMANQEKLWASANTDDVVNLIISGVTVTEAV